MALQTNSENKFADVPLRVKTWIYIILVFAEGISHPFLMKLFVAWITYQAMSEILTLYKINYRKIISASVSFIQFCLLCNFGIELYLLYAFLLIINILVYLIITKLALKQIVGSFFGLAFCLLAFAHLEYIREDFSGIKTIIFVVVVTELNDVFQYLMGKFFGKRKIVPSISPNKTVEGFVGGVFLTVILSNILGYFLLSSSIFGNTVLGFVLGIFGFFGDVLMSVIKRDANVKDTGKLLPGHGGLLDRMDSLIFNAPLFFWILPVILKF